MHNNIIVIILSFLVISCSQKTHDEGDLLNNDMQPSSPRASSPKEKQQKYYDVKNGDTLYSLGLLLKLDYKKIAKWNNIKPPYKIRVRQRLYFFASKSDRQHAPREKKPAVRKINKKSLINSTDSPQTESRGFIGQHSFQRAQMVKEVLKANPQLEISRAVWQASSAKIKQQGALKDPILAYSFAPLTVDNDSTDYVQQVQLSQSLPWPGKLALQSDAAMYNANRDEEKINLLQLELTALAKKLYGDWFFNYQAHKIHNENVQLLTHVNKIAKIRYRIGKANQQEVLQSELELALIKRHEFILNQQKTEILAHINTLLSRPVDTPLPLAKILPRPLAMRRLKTLQKRGIEDHPKIKALSANIKSWERKKERAILESFPDFNINARYGTQMNNSDKHLTVGVALNLPFNLSKYQAIEDEATANLKRAQWEKQDQVQELAELIQFYYSKVKKYKKTLVLYKQKILPLAKRNKHAALANYQAGSGGFLELIKAEKNWHSARLKEKQMLVDYHESLALFEHAVGITDFSMVN